MISTNHTFINDTILRCTYPNCNDSNLTHILITENVTNVYMNNVNFNKSKISIINRDAATPEKNNITVSWILNMLVTDGTNPVTTAIVQINDSKGNMLYNGTVGTDGSMPSQTITEFTQNGTVNMFYLSCAEQPDESADATANFSCHMPLNISITAPGYNGMGFSYFLNSTKTETFTLTATGGAATCDCPASGTDHYINDGSICEYNGNCCDIGTGVLRINNGIVRDRGCRYKSAGMSIDKNNGGYSAN